VPRINLWGSFTCNSLAIWCCKSTHYRRELPRKTSHPISSI